ncbi:hypothetical protein B4U80_02610 [Leptotrombidium deliense]|uniref:Uncharacterized protein n=1 Tax=Leptotrombidium deliense TaxID=299467 RepID=A0A443SKR0_9ACAR|nr:hypothetical protein B4U80_02610 [Leptotrombidium deliense]
MAERTRRFSCMKYFLMASNAFGVMIGVFVVLFGIAYPKERFPGGYTGKQCAIFSCVFIFFTLFGYCSAHHQKVLFLLIYSVVIFFFVIGNAFFWLISPETSIVDFESNSILFLGILFIVIMIFALILSWQIRTLNENNSQQEPNEKSNIHQSGSISFNAIQRFRTRSLSGSSY